MSCQIIFQMIIHLTYSIALLVKGAVKENRDCAPALYSYFASVLSNIKRSHSFRKMIAKVKCKCQLILFGDVEYNLLLKSTVIDNMPLQVSKERSRMRKTFDSFRKAMREELQALNLPDIQEVLSEFRVELNELLKDHIVSAGPDYKLGGEVLEYRVQYIFDKMGFQIELGPPRLYDAIVRPFEGLYPEKPIVVEVKSSGKVGPSREDLRQLDDWVFELSREEFARKEGLGGGCDSLAWASYGVITKRHTHPNPHKGVLVFNGPIGQLFENRSENWLGEGEKEFAQKRDFCIISLECLISWYNGYQKDNSVNCNFWKVIHSISGILPPYHLCDA